MKIALNSTWPWLTARNTRGVVVALCRWQRADGRSPMPQGSFSLSVSFTGDSVVSLSLSLSLSHTHTYTRARQVYTVDEVQTRPCGAFSLFHLDRFVHPGLASRTKEFFLRLSFLLQERRASTTSCLRSILSRR